MHRLAFLAFFLLAGLGLSQAQFPPSTSQVAVPAYTNASSGNVAAGVATATLSAANLRLNYLCGFSITSSGSTGAAVVSPTVTGLVGGTMTFTYTTVAGATLKNDPLQHSFIPCVPAVSAATAIAVSVPSLGAGNTNSTVNAWGYQL